MTFYVSDETRKKTTRCPFDFVCLNSKKGPARESEQPRCRGLGVAPGEGLFIRPAATDDCLYLNRFGFGHYTCQCPVRNEIYSRYKV
ncbi:MAG TPA: hypothetical protein ENG95_05815 [Nitrospirae bacterium]|nr:hypothetical protein BMS3Abin10_00201 [bacterium BMS3Abin10]GBE39833.1 hypothetical protein BMS3Bbin08_02465 [bacterium BMS3Bbin08]HDH51117.1 hypothetical protein [Nitrospirota bacterium]HDK81832.1 hypothetical protein [Nitrospirota bacterium]HDO26138.1 hypothetical protein [Nitrospirota bacterium]